ncbi:ferric iron reductase protein FhuF [Pseudomonas sp. NFACC02]|uniref:siderophore-iron reductase FhuF n=1 Tax=Pseudomonas sp. NFACC02 TaxID=1566250 RepID=UPI0008BDD0C0|nr:siderophore-iron reductase FhuF [Pseudomonas sp. NFACC02]SEP80945.1 ferric iron reductase protein FhuF [Pseudomonas sp. NFACC02]
MIPALAPLFIDDFAHYRDVLVLQDDPRPSLPLRRLLAPDTFDAVLTRFAVQYPDSDRRGVASVWSKHYFIKLIPPVVAASLILNHRLPLRAEQLHVMLDAQGMPLGFKLPDPGQHWAPVPIHAFQRFDELIEGHLRSLIDTVATLTRLSPRVLWSNAGNYFEWLLGVLASAVPQADLRHGHDLLNAPEREHGQRNPLYQPVRYIEVAGQATLKRQRRVCCVRYRVGGLSRCDNCPLPDRRVRPGRDG